MNRLNIKNQIFNVHGYIGDDWDGDGNLMSELKNLNFKNEIIYVYHKDNFDKNTYLNIMRYNIQILKNN